MFIVDRTVVKEPYPDKYIETVIELEVKRDAEVTLNDIGPSLKRTENEIVEYSGDLSQFHFGNNTNDTLRKHNVTEVSNEELPLGSQAE